MSGGIPAGDPGALRAAAQTFTASAGALTDHSSSLQVRTLGQVGSWRGFASFAHAARTAGLARDAAASAGALERAAVATGRLADELEEAQNEARRVLAEMADAEANVASLRDSARRAEGPMAKMLHLEAADAGAYLSGLRARLAEIEERAAEARRRAAAAFEAISAAAPLVQAAIRGGAAFAATGNLDDPRLALLIDVIADAGEVSSPEELRERLDTLSASELQMVLAVAPGLALMLAGSGLPRHPAPGSAAHGLVAAIGAPAGQQRIDAVRGFFSGLSPNDAMVLALLYPAVVGNLDGAPIPQRIAANRVHMSGERFRLQGEIEDLEAREVALLEVIRDGAVVAPGTRYMPGPEMFELAEVREQLEAERDRLGILNELLDEEVENPRFGIDPGAPPTIERRFLVFDPAGDGRIAEIHGTLDARTRDVGILVPGTGADLNGFASLADRGRGFVDFNQDGSLTTISWLGYDAPDSVAGDAPFNNYADDGGIALRDFVAGLDLGDVDITVAGHSYGGAVVGVAEREGMRVDNVVHVASAGASVDNVSDYPNSANRYSLTAPGDLIQYAQGSADAEPADRGDNIGHGLDPDTMSGVVRLETGRLDAGDPGSKMLKGPGSHSDVFSAKKSHSWANIYNVMIGGEVTLYTPPGTRVIPTYPLPIVVKDYPMEDRHFEPPVLDVG